MRRAADVIHALGLEMISQVSRDVRRAVFTEKAGFPHDGRAVATGRLQRRFQRVRDLPGLQRGAELPRDDVTAVVVGIRGQVEPAPAASRQANAKRSAERARACFLEQPALQSQFGDDLFRGGRFRPQFLDLGRCRLTGRIARQTRLTGFRAPPFGTLLRHALSGSAFDQECDGLSAMPSRRHGAAMLSSPRRPAGTIPIFSSAE